MTPAPLALSPARTLAHTLAHTLALTLALAAPALAQDAPPAGAPTQPAHEPALDLIGAALLEADQNAVLKARLLDEQVFKAVDTRKGPMQALLRIRGEKSDKGISLVIQVTLAGMGERTMRYDFGPVGALERVELNASMRGREQRLAGRVEGDELVVESSREGEAAKTQRVPWRRDVMPMALGAFALPALADQGLPQQFSGAALRLERMGRSSMINEDKTIRFQAAGEVTRDGVRYRAYHLESKSDPIEALVYAEGERAGQVHSITFDYKKDEPDGSYVRISAAEAKRLAAEAPILNNELVTHRRVRELARQQQRARERAGKFSDEPEQLGLSEDETPGYLVLLRVSPDGQKWMAVAAPKDPGKTGKRYFAINLEGQVYASDQEIPLNDACTLPAGLEKLR